MDYEIVEQGLANCGLLVRFLFLDIEVTQGHSHVPVLTHRLPAVMLHSTVHMGVPVVSPHGPQSLQCLPAGLARESSPAAVRALGTWFCFLVTVWSRGPAQSAVSSLPMALEDSPCYSRELL